ncbi:MAG: hypothetical protein WBC76_00290 [Actinomycetes bacterium]
MDGTLPPGSDRYLAKMVGFPQAAPDETQQLLFAHLMADDVNQLCTRRPKPSTSRALGGMDGAQ